MDYERKYKEALEWMQSLYSDLHGVTKEEAEHYFPELKESDDEKIKRIIYSIIDKIGFHIHDIFTEEEFQCFDAWSHAWLEKQKEKQSIWTDSDRTMAFTLLRDVDQITYISNEGKKERMQWLNSLEDKFNNGE